MIANLFALEGYLLAHSLKIPCIIFHPHAPKPTCRLKELQFQHYAKIHMPLFYRDLMRSVNGFEAAHNEAIEVT